MLLKRTLGWEEAMGAAAGSWADLVSEGRLPRFVLICLAVWLNAADSLVTATIMPNVGRALGGYAAAFAGIPSAPAAFCRSVSKARNHQRRQGSDSLPMVIAAMSLGFRMAPVHGSMVSVAWRNAHLLDLHFPPHHSV
jgi:hypothetical protein